MEYPCTCPDAHLAPAARATAQARYDEGEAFFKRGKHDEALAAFRAAVEKDPEMSKAWFMIGVAEVKKNGGESCEAAHDPLKRAVELDPDDAGAHCCLGGVLACISRKWPGLLTHWAMRSAQRRRRRFRGIVCITPGAA